MKGCLSGSFVYPSASSTLLVPLETKTERDVNKKKKKTKNVIAAPPDFFAPTTTPLVAAKVYSSLSRPAKISAHDLCLLRLRLRRLWSALCLCLHRARRWFCRRWNLV